MTTQRRLIFLLSLVSVLFVLILIFLYLNFTKPTATIVNPLTPATIPIKNSPTPTVAIKEDFTTYKDDNASFQYPSFFVLQPIQLLGSSYTREFKYKNYIFSFNVRANYSQENGLPYTNIDKYVGLPYQTIVLNVDGVAGRQYSPRAGSENVNEAVFLTKDYIFILSLQTGDNPTTVTQADILEGQKYFAQIFPTLKITKSTVFTKPIESKTIVNNVYGYSFKYPSGAKLYGDSNGTAFSLIQNDKAVSIIIGNNSNNDSLQNFFLKQINSQDPQSISKYVNFTDFTIGSNKFVLAIQDPIYFKNQSTALNNYLITTNRGYIVNINTVDFSSSESKDSLINQTLSSLKIL